MPNLDRSRTYGEIWNAIGHAGYEQDGRLYDLGGRPLEPEPKPAAAARPAAAPTAKAPAAPDKRPDDELKTLVEIAGGKWIGRAAALAFLAEVE